MRKIAIVLSALLAFALVPTPAFADPWDSDACVIEYGANNTYRNYACVDDEDVPVDSHIILCQPARLPDGSYCCVLAPFPL